MDTSFWANFQWTPQHISLRSFGLRKPQKVPKEESTYFSLNLARSETLLLPKIPPGHFPRDLAYNLAELQKYVDTSLGTF